MPAISIPKQSRPRFALSLFIRITHARESRARFFRSVKTEARAHGFRALELMATLPGIEFYKSSGFKETGNYDLELTEAVKLELVPMRKDL